MSESIGKLMCGALLDVIKSLFNFDGVCLSSLLYCSDCFNFLSFENIPLSNALKTISLPLRSAIALFNTSSFTFQS